MAEPAELPAAPLSRAILLLFDDRAPRAHRRRHRLRAASCVDIHVKMVQQQPDYVRLNPNMTVPTLVLAGPHPRPEPGHRRVCAGRQRSDARWRDESLARPSLRLSDRGTDLRRASRAQSPGSDHDSRSGSSPSRRRLLERAARNPDLAKVYEARAAVFAERVRAFDPAAVVRLSEKRRAEAIGFMDRLEQTLHDGRAVLVPPAYGVADVVWTVFLARMEFVGLGAELPKRPALARYWRAMQARPSFAAQTYGRSCMSFA